MSESKTGKDILRFAVPRFGNEFGDVEDARKLWNVYDKDGSGILEESEGISFFKDFIQVAVEQKLFDLGDESLEVSAQRLFEAWDEDGDKKLFWTEFWRPAKIRSGWLLGMGNPLLDISKVVPMSYLEKYELKLNDACLDFEGKYDQLFTELVDEMDPEYIAAGATQNAIRVAQWMLDTKLKATTFIGCVGSDANAQTLRDCVSGDGVTVNYMVEEKEKTGVCACLIHEGERSLVARLSAANCYKIEHLQSPDMSKVLTRSEYVYIAGFFATVSPESIYFVGDHCNEFDKTFCMNLSAPFLPEFHGDVFKKVMPNVDYLFGNESEATAWGKSNQMDDTSPAAVAKAISQLPKNAKKSSNKPRVVVITQGADPTIVAVEGEITEFPVTPVTNIVDVNGAGDAFVGGFLSQLMQGMDIDICVNAGHYSASVILGVSGTKLPSTSPTFTNDFVQK